MCHHLLLPDEKRCPSCSVNAYDVLLVLLTLAILAHIVR